MNIGIVFRIFKISRFGFILNKGKSIFFHFSEVESEIDRYEVVTFDIENSERGLVAKNIRSIISIDGLAEKLYSAPDNESLKWIIVKRYPEFYQREAEIYLKSENYYEKYKLRIKQFDDYVNQFSTKKFWNNYKIDIGKKFGKLGGNDWIDAWWSVGIESIFEVNKLNKYSLPDDNYIKDLIYYWDFIEKIAYGWNKYNSDIQRIRSQIPEGKFKEIEMSIKKKFDEQYSKEEHIKSLDLYNPLVHDYRQTYMDKFDKIVREHFEQYLKNNLSHNQSIYRTDREDDEDYQATHLDLWDFTN